MSDNTTHTLTETELAEIHGGASYMDASGRVFIDETEVRPEAVGDVLTQIRESRGIGRVYLRADEANSYGTVMRVMGQLSASGFENVGLITEPLAEER